VGLVYLLICRTAALALGFALGVFVLSRFVPEETLRPELLGPREVRFHSSAMRFLLRLAYPHAPLGAARGGLQTVGPISRAGVVSVTLLVAALLASVGVSLRLWAETRLWRQEVASYAYVEGRYAGARDFRKGERRLYVLMPGDGTDVQLHRREGPFELWAGTYATALGEAQRYARQRYVTGYDAQMHAMLDRPNVRGRSGGK
jgi:hypothetical protein